MPKPIPRRQFDDKIPGYFESDKDYVLNNLDWCVLILDNALRFPLAKCKKCGNMNWLAGPENCPNCYKK